MSRRRLLMIGCAVAMVISACSSGGGAEETSTTAAGDETTTTVAVTTTTVPGTTTTEAVEVDHGHEGAGADPAQIAEANLATAAFQDVAAAEAAGYASTIDALGCFEDAEAGGMGLHYLNETLMDNSVDITTPEALVYELGADGAVTGLVAHEYIVPIEAWTDAEPPSLFGLDFHQHPVLPLWSCTPGCGRTTCRDIRGLESSRPALPGGCPCVWGRSAMSRHGGLSSALVKRHSKSERRCGLRNVPFGSNRRRISRKSW